MSGVQYKMFVIWGINPEPWALGPLSMGFKGKSKYPKIGQNVQLHDYQQAIKESILQAYPDVKMFPDPMKVCLHFKFWRQLETFTGGTGRKQSRNIADATNMQKALEDALQDILYANDERVKAISSEIMDEGPDVEPCILILAKEHHTKTFWAKIRDWIALNQRPSPPGNVYHTNYLTEGDKA